MQKIKLSATVLLIAMPGMISAEAVVLRQDDVQRLQNLNQDAGEAIRSAIATGQENDVDTLIDALSGRPLPPEEALKIIPGEWSCKMIKLGDDLPIVTYTNFKCLVTGNGAFEKTTGSQLTKGHLHINDKQLIYLGTAFVAGETPLPYNELPAEVSPQDTPQLMPEVGVVEMVGDKNGRILFPDPYLESQLNVLVLTR